LQPWCEGGVFRKVDAKYAANTIGANFQFTKKGLRAYNKQDRKDAVLHKLREMADEMVEKADVSVVYVLIAPDGSKIGGCFRLRGQPEATCTTR
jgi:endonuclease IV